MLCIIGLTWADTVLKSSMKSINSLGYYKLILKSLSNQSIIVQNHCTSFIPKMQMLGLTWNLKVLAFDPKCNKMQ